MFCSGDSDKKLSKLEERLKRHIQLAKEELSSKLDNLQTETARIEAILLSKDDNDWFHDTRSITKHYK